jgi:hypothetical protein
MTGAAGGGACAIGWQDGYYGAITGTTGQGTARTAVWAAIVGSNSTPLSAGGTAGAVTIAGTAALPVGFSVWMAHGPCASYIDWTGGHATRHTGRHPRPQGPTRHSPRPPRCAARRPPSTTRSANRPLENAGC